MQDIRQVNPVQGSFSPYRGRNPQVENRLAKAKAAWDLCLRRKEPVDTFEQGLLWSRCRAQQLIWPLRTQFGQMYKRVQAVVQEISAEQGQ